MTGNVRTVDTNFSTSSQQLLSVVVPIYNEIDALPDFIPGLVSTAEEKHWHLILVDDGSTDGSSKWLAGLDAHTFIRIIRHPNNRGYGSALKTGLNAAATPYVVTIDGDGQHTVLDIEKILNFMLQTQADLVVGNRGRWKNASLYRSLGKWLIRLFTQAMMPLSIRDLNSGFKLYRTELVQKYLKLCPNTMAFSHVITLAFIYQRDLVLEHPITVRERSTGKSTIGFHTAFDTLLEILNLIMLFNPLRIFLPVSMVSILVGVGWGIPFILLGKGVSVGAMLAIVTGLLFFILGLIASQLSAIRINLLELTRRDDQRNE